MVPGPPSERLLSSTCSGVPSVGLGQRKSRNLPANALRMRIRSQRAPGRPLNPLEPPRNASLPPARSDAGRRTAHRGANRGCWLEFWRRFLRGWVQRVAQSPESIPPAGAPPSPTTPRQGEYSAFQARTGVSSPVTPSRPRPGENFLNFSWMAWVAELEVHLSGELQSLDGVFFCRHSFFLPRRGVPVSGEIEFSPVPFFSGSKMTIL